MARVLVVGAYGMLGSTLLPLLREGGHETVAAGRSEEAQVRLDLLDAKGIANVLHTQQPDVVVNLAALTDVDRCERLPQEAFLANVRGVENLARGLREMRSPPFLVHMSTDHVYDGGVSAHDEDDVTLVNCYAYSKYAGELAARSVPAAVLRTNFFGRSARAARASFSDWIVKALRGGESIKVFEDVLFNPLSMRTLGAVVLRVIELRPDGLFNTGSRGGISKADFAFGVAETLGLPTQTMQRSTLRATTGHVRRPFNMLMDCARLEAALGIRMPEIKLEIRSLEDQYHVL